MKKDLLFLLTVIFISTRLYATVPILPDFPWPQEGYFIGSPKIICTDGIMDENKRCHSCYSEYKFKPQNIKQAIENCPNRFWDLCGTSTLKCEDNQEAIDHKCLLKCQDGEKRNDKGLCCKEDLCWPGCVSIAYITRSPFFIKDDKDAKNFTCNNGVMDRDGRCHSCLDDTSILTQNSQESIKNCPNRLMDGCGYSKLKCGTDEEKIGNKCLQKCKDGFTRNKDNECCNQNTGECVTRQYPRYL